MGDKRRVLYAPRNISGQATEYLAGIRSYGWEGEVWSYGPPAFGFHADRVIDKGRWAADPEYRWSLFDEAVRRFDVFHFQYASSLLIPKGYAAPDLWDLVFLKSLGKKVFMHFRGSDVRLRSKHMEREPDSYFRTSEVACDEQRILGKLEICRRYCDDLFTSTPGLLDYVPEATWIPHALDPDSWDSSRPMERAVPVVLHIPSRRGTKNSTDVDSILSRLHDECVIIYRSLEGLSRQELKTALQEGDIVVDSIGIGDHGLISVEAMAAGAIAVAHVRETARLRNAGVPVVEATGATLRAVIQELAGNPEERKRLRESGRAWVRWRHDRNEVGRLLIERYERPVREVDLSYPNWPRSETRDRVLALERALERERIRAAAAERTGGAGLLEAKASPAQGRNQPSIGQRLRRRAARYRILRRMYYYVKRAGI